MIFQRLRFSILTILLYASPLAGFAQAPQIAMSSYQAGPYPTRPDATLTPGAVLPVTVADIRVVGYTKKVRNVPEAVKRQVFAEYHISPKPGEKFEVDHLISLELGGSNDIKNLWPEPYFGSDNAHDKDRLENKLHDLVCSGKMTLADAQAQISHDWIACYVQVFGVQPGKGVK